MPAGTLEGIQLVDEVTITPTRNGPYHIKGKLRIEDWQGNLIEYDGDETWLCRCGGSQNKPFCDGTHRKNGFQASQLASDVKRG